MSDLCSLSDIKSYVPGYTGTTDDAVLTRLIASESDLFQQDANREIIGRITSAEARRFTVNDLNARMRRIPIGDLTTSDGIDVILYNSDATEDGDMDGLYVPFYNGKRNPDASWEPVTELAFPRHLTDAADICTGKVLEVTGVWGFPDVPSFVREGVAARVITRYVTDVAAQGTDLSVAIFESNLSLNGLAQRADEALMAIQRKPWP